MEDLSKDARRRINMTMLYERTSGKYKNQIVQCIGWGYSKCLCSWKASRVFRKTQLSQSRLTTLNLVINSGKRAKVTRKDKLSDLDLLKEKISNTASLGHVKLGQGRGRRQKKFADKMRRNVWHRKETDIGSFIDCDNCWNRLNAWTQMFCFWFYRLALRLFRSNLFLAGRQGLLKSVARRTTLVTQSEHYVYHSLSFRKREALCWSSISFSFSHEQMIRNNNFIKLRWKGDWRGYDDEDGM